MLRKYTSCPEILGYIENHLPLCGTLSKLGELVYVNIDDEYVHQLVAFIEKEGFEEPPYFGQSDLVGAHITVIYPAEVRAYGIKEIKECRENIRALSQ